MLSKRIGNTLIVRVDRGEELIEGIKTAIKKEKIRLGIVSGIGAASSTTLGVYNVEEQKYYQSVFTGFMKLHILPEMFRKWTEKPIFICTLPLLTKKDMPMADI